MQIVRIYSGDDGESHFEDLTIDRLAEIVSRPGEGTINLGQGPAKAVSDYHPCPRRQYVMLLSGEVEVENADGRVRRIVRGDVIVAEDETGHGHIFRAVGEEPRVTLSIPIG